MKLVKKAVQSRRRGGKAVAKAAPVAKGTWTATCYNHGDLPGARSVDVETATAAAKEHENKNGRCTVNVTEEI